MDVKELSERQRKEIATLSRKKGRMKQGMTVVEGVRAVESAIQGGAPLRKVLVTHRLMEDAGIQDLLHNVSVPLLTMSEKAAQSVSTTENNQGILALVEMVHPSESSLLKLNSLVALDGIQDPGNVGSIIRSAAWFGIEGVLTGPGTADIYSPKTIRATMGGIWDVSCFQLIDFAERLAMLKLEGFELCGTFMDGDILSEWKPAPRAVLIIGNEAKGISDEIATLVDKRYTIHGHPSARATESLNAATAASIFMHHWRK